MAGYILADPKFLSDKERDEKIISNCNEIVEPDDIIYLMGDIGAGATVEEVIEVLNKINCKKQIIDGKTETPNAYEENGVFVWRNVDCFSKKQIDGKMVEVQVLCHTFNLVHYIANKTCAAAYSLPINKNLFKSRVLNLSVDNWGLYPIEYNQLPDLVHNKIKGVENNVG